MQTFRHIDRHLGAVPGPVVRTHAGLDRSAGLEGARQARSAEALKTLVEIARIQSTEASNAIEGIDAPHRRIVELTSRGAVPRNRPEAEIAGYRRVLDQIHSSADDIPFKLSVVLQFHRDLYSFTQAPAGELKATNNSVTETRSDGSVVVRFEPVSAADTPRFMDELHSSFDSAVAADEVHPLLRVAAYVFDFLMIHPFQDGNGRMARLITLWLLYQAGYGVGRYVSLERKISDSRETYYEALAASTRGWHESRHDIWPWVRYLLGTLTAAYRDFEAQLETVSGRGAKTRAVLDFIRSSVSEEFTIADIRRATPAVSDPQIRKVLNDLRDRRVIERIGAGRGARWRRVTREF